MIESLKHSVKRILRGKINFGGLARTTPYSRHFGFDRGMPIDRLYIERFLFENRDAIHGVTLEIGDDSYTRQFGEDRTTTRHVLHIDGSNPVATIVGDMSQPEILPEAAFDCAVITQTLHLIYDMRAAVRNLHNSLKPGGTLLLTTPGISQIATDQWRHNWYWSMTPAGARRLFGEAFGEDRIEVDFHGNVFAAIAFLTGAAVEEVPRRRLLVKDEAYPVVVTVRATRRS